MLFSCLESSLLLVRFPFQSSLKGVLFLTESVGLEFIGVLLILIGSVVSVMSAIGMIRFPDIYTRAHAATKTTTLAVLISLVGVFLYFLIKESLFSVRILLGIIFVFLTAPVSGHLVLRASYRARVKMADSTIEDELKEVLFPEEKELSNRKN